jgi:methyl coenzyme M reductase subunit C-like uncharacterized protein (methanogenesis marker protein 7)
MGEMRTEVSQINANQHQRMVDENELHIYVTPHFQSCDPKNPSVSE